MDWLLQIAIGVMIRRGNLRVTSARGTTMFFGDGTGPRFAVRFTSARTQWSVLFDPELKLGEAYMDGTFIVEEGALADFLALVMAEACTHALWWTRILTALRFVWRRISQFNPPRRARRNVAHHYDLDSGLYTLFLDSDRQYSCAYFDSPDLSLDDAQLTKKRHVVAKLLVDRDRHVLDIGCGWGGLALYLAEICGARVTGVTLSEEQLALARIRANEKEVSGAVDFRLCDYRDVTDKFDRVVSVGMFEHVGVGYYDRFFGKCADLLKDDGIFLLHSIGRSEGPGITNAWIAKYIFPGGYIPALSEVLPAIERAGLLVTDIEILRLHYADTLAAWRERFVAHRDDAERLYDPRFVRMWEFYLAASEMGFRKQNLMVFQVQLTKQQGVVPITRSYIASEEAGLRALEGDQRPPLRLAGAVIGGCPFSQVCPCSDGSLGSFAGIHHGPPRDDG